MNRLWVVEMMIGKVRGKPVWGPTVGVALTRDQAREEWTQWSADNQADKFRVREYRPYGDRDAK